MTCHALRKIRIRVGKVDDESASASGDSGLGNWCAFYFDTSLHLVDYFVERYVGALVWIEIELLNGGDEKVAVEYDVSQVGDDLFRFVFSDLAVRPCVAQGRSRKFLAATKVNCET